MRSIDRTSFVLPGHELNLFAQFKVHFCIVEVGLATASLLLEHKLFPPSLHDQVVVRLAQPRLRLKRRLLRLATETGTGRKESCVRLFGHFREIESPNLNSRAHQSSSLSLSRVTSHRLYEFLRFRSRSRCKRGFHHR